VHVVSLPLVTDGSSLGALRGVAEKDGAFVAFGDQGIAEVRGGAVTARFEAAKEWASAGAVPAPDGTGTWAAGLTADGRLVHLLDAGRLEDVGLRYGVAEGQRITGFVTLGATSAAIALEAELVVADVAAATTRRFATGKLASLSAHGSLVAGASAEGVAVLDVATGKLTKRALADVRATAFDREGRLLAATPHAIHRAEGAGGLELVASRADVEIRGLVTTPARTWIVQGTELWALDAAGLHRAAGAVVDADATLAGSATGDAWLLGARPARWHVDEVNGEDLWREKALPIYERVCRDCHSATGASGVDLSTYDGWVRRRDAIRQRVVLKGDMPPKPRELTTDDKAAIDAVLGAMKP